jgi:hypothetical protein
MNNKSIMPTPDLVRKLIAQNFLNIPIYLSLMLKNKGMIIEHIGLAMTCLFVCQGPQVTL